MLDWYEQAVAWAESHVPRLALAAVLAVLGFVLGKLLSAVVVRLLRRWSSGLLSVVDRVTRRRADTSFDRVAAEETALRITGRIVFWVVFVLFLAAATSVIGVPVVSNWLSSLAAYLPQVFAAAAILLLGLLFGHLLRVVVLSAAAGAGLPYARALAQVAQVAVVLVAAVVAIEELGVEVTFLIVVTATVLAAVLGGAALAFGLGARTDVGNMVACHYLMRTYKVGHVVRIGGHEGRIVAIMPTAVILDTDEGRVHMPASEFSRSPSVLIEESK